MARLPTKEEIDEQVAAFQPYYEALGKTAHAWNHLQEELAQLFCEVGGIDPMGLRLWHALKSDRSQRDLLEAALHSALEDEKWAKKYPKAKTDITWLLVEANRLADRRNDAIHAPCTIGIKTGQLEIVPFSFYGNPRAKKLQGKQILNEFGWYEKSADTLRHFAISIAYCFRSGEVRTWPDRPHMPALRQDSIRD
jgi:hypothetical protein